MKKNQNQRCNLLVFEKRCMLLILMYTKLGCAAVQNIPVSLCIEEGKILEWSDNLQITVPKL